MSIGEHITIIKSAAIQDKSHITTFPIYAKNCRKQTKKIIS